MGREDHRSVEARIPNLAGFSGTTPAQKKEPALQAPLKLGWLKVRLPSSYSLPFLGQFAELPDDVVFTVEYSVRSAQIAVYTLLPLPEKPSPFYKGQYDPKVMWEALETLHR